MGKLRIENDLQAKLEPMVSVRQNLIAQRDQILQEIAAMSDAISTELVLADQKSLRVGPYLVTIVENQGRNTLDKKRLVELGVDPETIMQATVRGAPSTSLQVRTASEE